MLKLTRSVSLIARLNDFVTEPAGFMIEPAKTLGSTYDSWLCIWHAYSQAGRKEGRFIPSNRFCWCSLYSKDNILGNTTCAAWASHQVDEALNPNAHAGRFSTCVLKPCLTRRRMHSHILMLRKSYSTGGALWDQDQFHYLSCIESLTSSEWRRLRYRASLVII